MSSFPYRIYKGHRKSINCCPDRTCDVHIISPPQSDRQLAMASVPTISAESFDFEAWVLLENFGWDILGEFGYNFKAKGYNKYDNLLKLTEDDLKEMNCDDDRFRKRLLLAIKRLAEGLQSVAYGLLVS